MQRNLSPIQTSNNVIFLVIKRAFIFVIVCPLFHRDDTTCTFCGIAEIEFFVSQNAQNAFYWPLEIAR